MNPTPPSQDEHPHVVEHIDEIKEHPDQHPLWLADRIDNFILSIAHLVCWANGILIGVIVLQVVLRYGFSHGLVMLEELQWHLYALAVMVGLSYAQVNDSHIRVDVLHARLSERSKRIIEVIGTLVLVLPFIWVVFYHSLDFVADAWRTGEHSDAPLGLPYRWVIKSVIPFSFGLLGLAVLSRLMRDLWLLVKGN